ncbi:hypothetical protein BJY01DRAFT_255789 [Aspergillus pseudoustus]|uniref:Uncharacterized protein n=1 Tax=Aspergillus pseudoustus TaxID=1810923 RepID=A0ABR4IH85_9EURO
MQPPTYDLVIGKSVYPDNHPQSWVLIIFPGKNLPKSSLQILPNTYYYIQGGPHHDPQTEYEAFVDVDTEFYAWTISTMDRICAINDKDRGRVDKVVNGMKAEHSQGYVCSILMALEIQLVPHRTAEMWEKKVAGGVLGDKSVMRSSHLWLLYNALWYVGLKPGGLEYTLD